MIDWVKLDRVLDEAIALAGDRRRAFVDDACVGEPKLRAEVERYLALDHVAPDKGLEQALGRTLSATLAAPLAVGDRIAGRFTIEAQVGRGGMAEVYRVAEDGFGRELAMKVIRPELHLLPGAEERFLREARLTGRLQHPGIVPVHDMGRLDGGRPFFTMKLVRGETLEARLAADRTAPTEERLARRLRDFERVCDALAYAHQQQVVHRDLKPANIMVGAFGEVQVMDWGIAKVLGSPEKQAAHPDVAWIASGAYDQPLDGTRSGVVLGTLKYMAPEQARGEIERIDARTDVFALGAILCELLTGHPPYRWNRETEAATMVALNRAAGGHLDEAFQRLDAVTAGQGNDEPIWRLVALARQCLDPDPDGRPADAGQVREELAAYFLSVARKQEEARVTAAQVVVERKRRRIAVALVVVLALFGVATAWGALVYRGLSNDNFILAGKETTARELAEQREKENLALAVREKASADSANSRLRDQYLEKGRQHMEAGDYLKALPYFARPVVGGPDLSAAGDDAAHRLRLGVMLRMAPRLEHLLPAEAINHIIPFSDGRRFVALTQDNRLLLYDAAGGEPVPLGDQLGLFPRVVISEDDRLLLAADTTDLRIWDIDKKVVATHVSINRELGGFGTLLDACRCGSGFRIAYSINRQVHVWDTARKGRATKPIETAERVLDAVLSPDGSRLAVRSGESLLLWNVESDKEIRAVEWKGGIAKPVFSPNGVRVAISDGDGLVATDVDRDRVVKLQMPLMDRRAASGVTFGPTSDLILVRTDPRACEVWDLRTGLRVGEPIRLDAEIRTADWTPDGMRILTAAADGQVRLWEARTGKPASAPLVHGRPVVEATIADGRRVLTRTTDHIIRIWDANPPPWRPKEWPGSVGSVVFDPTGRRAVAVWQNKASLRDPATGEVIGQPIDHPKAIQTVAFSHDGTLVVTGSEDGSVRVWNALTGRPQTAKRMSHRSRISAAAFSPQGDRIATAGWDGTVRLWNSRNGEPGPIFRHDNDLTIINGVVFSPDGDRIVTETIGKLTIWDAKTGKKEREVEIDKLAPKTFSSDSTRLHEPRMFVLAGPFRIGFYRTSLAGANEQAVRGHIVLWEPDGPEGPARGIALDSKIRAASLSADGELMAVGGADGTARLLNLRSGREVIPPIRHGREVTAVGLHSSGRVLLTGGKDGTLRAWDGTSGEALTMPIPSGRVNVAIKSAAFLPGNRLAIMSGIDALTWELPLPESGAGPLGQLAEVVSGHRLNGPNGLTPLDTAELAPGWAAIRRFVAADPTPPEWPSTFHLNQLQALTIPSRPGFGQDPLALEVAAAAAWHSAHIAVGQPGHDFGSYQYVELLRQANRWREVVALLDRQIADNERRQRRRRMKGEQTNPGNADTLRVRALAHGHLGRFDLAAADLFVASENPTKEFVNDSELGRELARGVNASQQKLLADSLAVFDGAKSAAKGHHVWLALGLLQVQKGDDKLAAASFLKAAGIDLKDGRAWYALGLLLARAEKWAEVNEMLTVAIQAKITGRHGLPTRARAAAALGKWPQVAEDLWLAFDDSELPDAVLDAILKAADAELAQRPNNGAAHLARALCLDAFADWAACEAAANAVLKAEPANWRALHERGVARFNRMPDPVAPAQVGAGFIGAAEAVIRRHARVRAAETDLAQALKHHQVDWRLWNFRATIRRELGDLDGAIKDISEAIERQPHWWLHRDRAQMHAAARRWKPAIDDCSTAIKLGADHGEVWEQRAFAHTEQKSYQLALEDCDTVLALGIKVPAIQAKRCFALAALRRSRPAVDDLIELLEQGFERDYSDIGSEFAETLKANPQDGWAAFGRGLARVWAKKFEPALEDFEQAASAGVSDPRLWAARGEALAALTRWKEADAAFSRAIADGHDTWRVRRGRASARRALGQFADAYADLYAALHRPGFDPRVLLDRAQVMLDLGHSEGAVADLKAAANWLGLPDAPQVPKAEVWERGEQLFDRAIAANPRSPELHRIRAAIRGQRGDASGAVADRKRARELTR